MVHLCLLANTILIIFKLRDSKKKKNTGKQFQKNIRISIVNKCFIRYRKKDNQRNTIILSTMCRPAQCSICSMYGIEELLFP